MPPLTITQKGLPEVREYIQSLPKGVRVVAMREFATYQIGDTRHGLKHEPAWKFFSRAQAYGKVSDAPAGYFSWKQFRYVAWKTEGFTKGYTRTHDIANAWTMHETDSSWTHVSIKNEAEGADWVVGEQQAAQPAGVGWRKWVESVADNMAGAMRAANQAVARWLKTKGK